MMPVRITQALPIAKMLKGPYWVKTRTGALFASWTATPIESKAIVVCELTVDYDDGDR
jgi:hypothetical protein